MRIETLKYPIPRNRNSISVIKSKFLSVSSMNTLLAILKITDARRDVILPGGLYHRFPWRHHPPPPPPHHLFFTIGTFSIRFFMGNCKPQIAKCHVTTALRSRLQFTFEPQEGLPAVSDLRQGFLRQKIVQPRV